MTYKELKQYFEQNKNNLPKSVGNGYMLVNDTRETVGTFIAIVEAEIKKGVKLKESAVAGAAKENLHKIYKMIQNEENHNKKELNFTRYSNFKRQI